jgi:hypothetical protein
MAYTPTLGLSMIVKNEHHVILRSLSSIAPIIDYWTNSMYPANSRILFGVQINADSLCFK